MKLQTKSFGDIQISIDKVIQFKEGLLGFSDLKEYILLDDEEESPFQYLQSINDRDICFPVVNPYRVSQTYKPTIATNDLKKIQGLEQEICILSIVTIRKNIEETTINLAAPVIINTHNKCGIQVILKDNIYVIKQKLMDFIS